MPKKNEFTGFTKKTVSYFKQLAKNNNKGWFDAHHAEYDNEVVAPAKAFVTAWGEALRPFAPGIVADPRTNRSLFRINRDTRFSKDKTHYKTNLGLWLWEGPNAERMSNSGFYFHLEPPEIWVGVGLYLFPQPLLEPYRRDVVHPVHGAALADAVNALKKKGYEIGGESYKRVPRGYDPAHPNADLLRHIGLYVGISLPIPDVFYTATLPEWCARECKKVLPLHQWLVGFTERMQ